MRFPVSKIACIILLSIFPCACLLSQEVPYSVSNYGVYDFLDELAALKIIEINSAVKPYSRLFIANRLQEVDKKRDQLNPRQQKELDFYLMDFGKESGRVGEGESRRGGEEAMERWSDGATVLWFGGRRSVGVTRPKIRRDLFYYKDSLFSLTVNPIVGGEIFTNSSGKAWYARNFGEARAYVQNWGFYASLRDNHEKPFLGRPEFLTRREGGHIKGSTDWSEMQGGVTWAWKWGNIGFVKERLQWGNNYNGANIFGGNNPTFVQLKLNLKPARWFEFNYFHGWLNSMVVDSSRSYWVASSYGTDYREVYHKKFIAANMFTITPVKNLKFSAGNSIVYTDKHFNPVYLMPVFFYKSVDHSYTSGVENMNSQTFIDISSRNIKNLHLYATLFIDELSVSRFTKNDEWNFFSWKTGFRLYNLPIQNLSFTTEFTYSYPLTYQHYVPTLTFENAGYNLGHYLRDNSREWYLAIDYKPTRTLKTGIYFTDAIRGPDYTELGTPRVGNPPLESVEWHYTVFGARGSYQIINDLYTWFELSFGDIRGDSRWSPEYFYGAKTTFNIGATFGF
ncbi:MAG: hypothetical protein WAL29_12750 [Bacteroidales bacterium]